MVKFGWKYVEYLFDELSFEWLVKFIILFIVKNKIIVLNLINVEKFKIFYFFNNVSLIFLMVKIYLDYYILLKK